MTFKLPDIIWLVVKILAATSLATLAVKTPETSVLVGKLAVLAVMAPETSALTGKLA